MSRAKFNRCSLQVRDLPLEAFRLPRDGRKWKQLAKSRYGLLLEISMYANGDGTFLSPDAKINFSPSAKRLLRHRTKDTLYRLANDLRELGLLCWHRNNHYGRRFYWIQLSGKQVRYSPENRSDIQNNRSDQQYLITGPTSSTYPSLEPLPSGGSPGSPPPVSEETQFYGKGERSLAHHHQSSHNTPGTKTADDEKARERSQNPKQLPESAEARQRRFKDSAFVRIKSECGNLYTDDLIREHLERIEARAKATPNSVEFYWTAFRNDIPNLETTVARGGDAPIPNAPPVEPPSDNSVIPWDEVEDLVFYAERHRPNASQKALERGWNLVHKKIVRFQNHTGEFRTPEQREDFRKYVVRLKDEQKARDAKRIRKNERSRERYKNREMSHDELLKDENNYGIMRWGGVVIVVRTEGRREILSREAIQTFTGASCEHMVEHLNSIGFWAEIYKPAARKTGTGN